MNFIISGKNIEVTPGLKDAIEQKLSKLERYFTPETEIIVTLSVEKGRQKIEVTIPVKGNIIRSEQTSNDMYVSIDLVEEIIASSANTKTSWFQRVRDTPLQQLRQAVSVRSLLNLTKRPLKTARSALSARKSSASSPCSLKMPASKWNFSGIVSSYSPTQRLMR